MRSIGAALLALIDKVSSKSRHEVVGERGKVETEFASLPVSLEPMIAWFVIALHWRRVRGAGHWLPAAYHEFAELYPGVELVNLRDTLKTPWGTVVDGVRDAGAGGASVPQWVEFEDTEKEGA